MVEVTETDLQQLGSIRAFTHSEPDAWAGEFPLNDTPDQTLAFILNVLSRRRQATSLTRNPNANG